MQLFCGQPPQKKTERFWWLENGLFYSVVFDVQKTSSYWVVEATTKSLKQKTPLIFFAQENDAMGYQVPEKSVY